MKRVLLMVMLSVIIIGGGIIMCFGDTQEFDYGQHCIAHAGGMIDGYKYTNSLEAVENAINHGVRYIEMDLAMTSDGYLVCTHSWNDFNRQTGYPDSHIPVSYKDFQQRKLYGYLTPMTPALIDSIWNRHPDLYLVTQTR